MIPLSVKINKPPLDFQLERRYNRFTWFCFDSLRYIAYDGKQEFRLSALTPDRSLSYPIRV